MSYFHHPWLMYAALMNELNDALIDWNLRGFLLERMHITELSNVMS